MLTLLLKDKDLFLNNILTLKLLEKEENRLQ